MPLYASFLRVASELVLRSFLSLPALRNEVVQLTATSLTLFTYSISSSSNTSKVTPSSGIFRSPYSSSFLVSFIHTVRRFILSSISLAPLLSLLLLSQCRRTVELILMHKTLFFGQSAVSHRKAASKIDVCDCWAEHCVKRCLQWCEAREETFKWVACTEFDANIRTLNQLFDACTHTQSSHT